MKIDIWQILADEYQNGQMFLIETNPDYALAFWKVWKLIKKKYICFILCGVPTYLKFQPITQPGYLEFTIFVEINLPFILQVDRS